MKTQETLPRASAAGIALKRILVPVDFSPLSKKALQYAIKLAREFNAAVNLFHVVEPEIPPAFDGFMIAPPPISQCATNGYANRLDRLANSARTAGVSQVRSIVRKGLAAFEIVEAMSAAEQSGRVSRFFEPAHHFGVNGVVGWGHVELGDLQTAATLAPKVDARSLPVERRVRHALEVARVYTMTHQEQDALHTLLQAERDAPAIQAVQRRDVAPQVAPHDDRPPPPLEHGPEALEALLPWNVKPILEERRKRREAALRSAAAH